MALQVYGCWLVKDGEMNLVLERQVNIGVCDSASGSWLVKGGGNDDLVLGRVLFVKGDWRWHCKCTGAGL